MKAADAAFVDSAFKEVLKRGNTIDLSLGSPNGSWRPNLSRKNVGNHAVFGVKFIQIPYIVHLKIVGFSVVHLFGRGKRFHRRPHTQLEVAA